VLLLSRMRRRCSGMSGGVGQRAPVRACMHALIVCSWRPAVHTMGQAGAAACAPRRLCLGVPGVVASEALREDACCLLGTCLL
jgi:hypothetical protein